VALDSGVARSQFPELAKRAALIIAWLVLVAAVIEFLLAIYRKYAHFDEGSYSIFWSRREWLWAHLAGGTLTVFLGPFQFLSRLRNAFPGVHRWTGRIYLVALLVGCIGAAGLVATTPGGFGLQVAFATTELAWLFTATVAFAAIRRRHPALHRRWMVRNYMITFVFVTFRVAILIPGVMTLGPPSVVIPTLLVAGWAVPLAIYEAMLLRARRCSRDAVAKR
jgi:hypothetical protein